MAEQGYDYDQYAPQSGGRLFNNAMFGFNKEEVLEYLDELADENYQRQEAAEQRIQDLTQRIHGLEAAAAQVSAAGQGAAGEAVTDEMRQQAARLAEELDIARAATQQAEEDLAEAREQAFNARQENDWLRDERGKADAQIAELSRRLDSAASGRLADDGEAERRMTALREQLDEVRGQAFSAQQENDRLRDAYGKADAQIAELNSRLDSAASGQAADGGEAERQMAALRGQLDEAREQMFGARQENDRLRDAYGRADAQIAELNSRLDSVSSGRLADGEEAERKMDALRERLSEATAAAKRADEERAAAVAAARAAAARPAPVADPSALSVASAAIIADANAEAERIRAVASDEAERTRRRLHSSAGGLAVSITNLRTELGGVESDVSRVLDAVQTSLADIISALGRTEHNLNTLGVQVERFPAASPPVPPSAPRQAVYFKPDARQLVESAQHTSRALEPESHGQAGFRRVSATPAPPPSGNARPFRAAYTSSPTAAAARPLEDAYPAEDSGDERVRALAENLVDTLVQMMT